MIFRKEIETADDPEARRAELIEEYTERFANPYIAAERGYVDDVIDPRETRRVLVRSLTMLRTKREQLPSASTATCRSNGRLRCASCGPAVPRGSASSPLTHDVTSLHQSGCQS